MNIHEYQARQLFRAAGIPVPDGDVATTPDEVEAIAERLGGGVVVKAQVHAGGRGKAGGVKLANTPAEAREAAEQILRPVLHQKSDDVAPLDPLPMRPVRVAVPPGIVLRVADRAPFEADGFGLGSPGGPLLDQIGCGERPVGLELPRAPGDVGSDRQESRVAAK